MSFTIGELTGWLAAAGIPYSTRRADGSTWSPGAEGLQCRRAVTDSRLVEDGTLFCAVQGDERHGADFLEQALQAGAVAVLVESASPEVPGFAAPVIGVEDGRAALAAAARGWLDARGPRVIGITGSNGKTTTKDFLGAALGGEFPVSVSPGNLNSLWGLPLAVLGFRGDERWLVLEMGASAPDEIGRLAAIARPWMGCVTNVAPAHLEGFGSVEEVIRTKMQLLESLPEEGVGVLNADDPRFDVFRKHCSARRTVSFGRSAAADVRIEEARPADEGLWVKIDGHTAVLPVFGEMNASNAAAAMAMAHFCGVPSDRALERISRASLSPHRSRTCTCAGRVVVDDSYNANPASMRHALDSLAMWPGSRSRIAVLADMAELGPESVALHREVLDHAMRRGLDLVLVTGPIFAEAAPAELPAGLEVVPRIDVDTILERIGERTRPGDLVLLKGSRSSGLERVLETWMEREEGATTNEESTP